MKKYCILFVLTFLCIKEILGNHTKGGWMYYEYLGQGSAANTSKYRITLKVYTECTLNAGQLATTVPFTIFNAANFSQVYNITVPEISDNNVTNCTRQECYPCIDPIPLICYRIHTYILEQELPNSPGGYIVSYQRCCRIPNIVNIQSPSESYGETWTVTIPGTAVYPGAEMNSSAKFSQNDTAIICNNNAFTFDFSATDINNDSLVYDFTAAYTGGARTNPIPDPSNAPPFSTLSYSGGFSAHRLWVAELL